MPRKRYLLLYSYSLLLLLYPGSSLSNQRSTRTWLPDYYTQWYTILSTLFFGCHVYWLPSYIQWYNIHPFLIAQFSDCLFFLFAKFFDCPASLDGTIPTLFWLPSFFGCQVFISQLNSMMQYPPFPSTLGQFYFIHFIFFVLLCTESKCWLLKAVDSN